MYEHNAIYANRFLYRMPRLALWCYFVCPPLMLILILKHEKPTRAFRKEVCSLAKWHPMECALVDASCALSTLKFCTPEVVCVESG